MFKRFKKRNYFIFSIHNDVDYCAAEQMKYWWCGLLIMLIVMFADYDGGDYNDNDNDYHSSWYDNGYNNYDNSNDNDGDNSNDSSKSDNRNNLKGDET